MALSRELKRRLRIEDESLSKRLKLAENAFKSEDFPAVRKDDLVLQWLCEEIAKTSENCIWNTLAKCLKFRNNCVTQYLKSDVKKILIETIIEKCGNLKNEESLDFLDCCRTIFASCEFCQYFQSNVDVFCKLMMMLFALTSDQIEDNADSGTTYCLASDTCINGIRCFVTCYKQVINKDEFAEIFISEILFPLCGLLEKKYNNAIGAETFKSIQQIIFRKSRYSQFKEYNEVEDNFVGKIFMELKNKSETSSKATVVIALSLFFEAAVGSYKNDSATIDLIFRNLLDSVSSAKAEVFERFSVQLKKVTLDYQNKINEITLFEYLEKFVEELISSKDLEASSYRALAEIANLNPLIIEVKIEKLLLKIVRQRLEEKDDELLYGDLMSAIIKAITKLRREQKFIPWILKAIEENLQDDDLSFSGTLNILPNNFEDSFSESLSNMTSIQAINVFRSLIYYLNNVHEKITKNDITGRQMLGTIIDLITIFFGGVRVFDNFVSIAGQEKFVQALRDLAKTISLLLDEIFEIKDNSKMITAVLTLTRHWEQMHDWVNYYIPEAIPEKLEFPISETQMSKIINLHNEDCEIAMDEILLYQMAKNVENEQGLNFSKLSTGLKNIWKTIIDDKPQIISLMTNSQILELAHLLSTDIKFLDIYGNPSKCDSDFSKRIDYEIIQNDERFTKALVSQTLTFIAESVNNSTSKKIAGRINGLDLLNGGEESGVLKKVKRDFEKQEWKSFDENSILVIKEKMQILRSLPLQHLSQELRMILLFFVLAVNKESEWHRIISPLSSFIITDLSEKYDIDVINSVDPNIVLDELTRTLSIQRVLESSLKHETSWETLKLYLKRCQTDQMVAYLLESFHRVRPKLKIEQREIIKKAEQKFSKKILSHIHEEMTDEIDLIHLNIALRGFMSNEEIPDKVITVTKSYMHHIFMSEGVKKDVVVEEGLKLVTTCLKHRNKLEIDEDIIKKIWTQLFQYPNKETVQLLLERTNESTLGMIFQWLQSSLRCELVDIRILDKCSIIWDCVTSAPMGGSRQKLRTEKLLLLLQGLQVAKISADSWQTVLKMVHSTLAEPLHFAEKGIDIVFLLAARSLNEAELSVCEAVIALCLYLVKFNDNLVTDRLPVLLKLYRKIVRLVVRESRKDNNIERQRQLGCLALDIEKLSNALAKMKKDLTRISPYIIADLVQMFGEGVIPARVKGPLEDSVGHFLSISDHHAISLLSRTLPPASRTIFQNIYDTYNKFYKFTGKI